MERVLQRRSDDCVVYGVAGGVGQYFGVEPAFVRVLFVVLTLFSGLGLVAYLTLALLVRRDSSEAKSLTLVLRENGSELFDDLREITSRSIALVSDRSRTPSGRKQLLGATLVLAGLALLANNLGFFNLTAWTKLWPVILVVIGGPLLAHQPAYHESGPSRKREGFSAEERHASNSGQSSSESSAA